MPTEPPSPSPALGPQRWLRLLGGIIAANLIAGLLWTGLVYALAKLAADSYSAQAAAATLPSLFLVPILAGLLAAFFWRKLNPRIGEVALHTLFLTLLALAGGALILREGVICLLIVSPLYYTCVLMGALLGRIWFRPDPARLRVTILPLVALLIMGEPATRAPSVGKVTDKMLIRAPPGRVWPLVTSFPPITAAPDFWLFHLGLPYPVATTSGGDFVGADRRCIFSDGAVFKESVAEPTPGRVLTFNILESPKDPELIGHLTPERGQFLLRDNRDGTTTLIGTTWYSLHVRPLWYFDWWTHYILQAVHLRVMDDVRRRAETLDHLNARR